MARRLAERQRQRIFEPGGRRTRRKVPVPNISSRRRDRAPRAGGVPRLSLRDEMPVDADRRRVGGRRYRRYPTSCHSARGKDVRRGNRPRGAVLSFRRLAAQDAVRSRGNLRPQEHMRRSTFRPLSIAEIAERAAGGTQSFDPAVREFLQFMAGLLARRPGGGLGRGTGSRRPGRGRLSRGTCRASGVGRSNRCTRMDGGAASVPARAIFRRRPRSLKAILIVESPSAFRRRLIFISADALSRPRRGFVEEDARTSDEPASHPARG